MSSGQSATLDTPSAGSPSAAQTQTAVGLPEEAPEMKPAEPAAGDVSPVSWSPRDEMDRIQWLDEGRKLGAVGRGSQWWIGDWVRYGTAKWGEKYVEAAKLTGYDEASLRNMAWVASQFDDMSLRSDKLSWSHHVLLAPLDTPKKREWLEKAAEERLSVSGLRESLHPKPKPEPEAAAEDLMPDAEGTEPRNLTATCPNCGHDVSVPLATAAPAPAASTAQPAPVGSIASAATRAPAAPTA